MKSELTLPKNEFDKISDEGLIEMLEEKFSLIRALVDEGSKLSAHLGYIEHFGEIRVKTAEGKRILKQLGGRITKLKSS